MDKRGKTKLSVLIISLLIVSFSLYFVLAASTNNTKSYDALNKQITINDSNGEMGRATLISNTDYCLKNCSAIIKLEVKGMYDKMPLSNIGIYELDKMTATSIKSLKIYISDEKKDIITSREENGTTVIDRNQVWGDYNYSALSVGTYYIKIIGEKDSSQSVEWIPNLFGLNIDEWASWESTIMVEYYTTLTQDAAAQGMGQSFTIGTTGTNQNWSSNLLSFYVRNAITAGATSCNWTMWNGSIGTGIAMTSNTTNCAELTSANKWINVSFLSVTFDLGSQYYWGVVTDSGKVIDTYQTQPSAYSGGNNYYTTDGTSWNSQSVCDSPFIIWGTNVTTDSIPPQTTVPIITPLTPKSNQNLQCNATLTDDKQTNLIAYWKWYKNDISNLSGSTPVTNGNYSLITTLDASNTTKGENWTCEVKPFDGYYNGTALNSSGVTILNSAPNQTNPLLATLSGKNFSYENLTCNNKSTYDADKDVVTNIYNWYKNNQPLTILNLPFEINAKDYSGYNNDGIINGGTFTDGKVGKALNFNGIDNTISVDLPNFPKAEFTFEMWFNAKEFASNGRDLFTKYSANDGFRTLITSSGGIESAWDIGNTFNTLTTTGLNPNTWYHFVVTYNGSLLALYLNGDLKDTKTGSGNLTTGTNTLTLGFNELATPNFNGTIDEVKIYNHALTSQQVSANYNLEYNRIVSQETFGGDKYLCQVTPNDAEEDGISLNSSVAEIKWAITFNVTSGEDGSQITSLDNIACNNSWGSGSVTSPFKFGFLPGSYECTFSKTNYYDKKTIFTADDDKTLNVKLSWKYSLTIEEHTWLEAIYNCLYSGDCSLYNLLLEVNQTVGKIWEQTKPTDESVITFENITNKVVDSTHNLTIDYSVSIPIKAGYVSGTYLPVRIGFWFMDETNTTCYNQGDKPTGVEEPYCQPLIIETLGPMGGSVNFTVKLHPSLPSGNYSIKRIIDIDPNNIWINYGQEMIGSFMLTESLIDSSIGLEKTGENNPSISSQQQSSGSSGNSGSSITNVYNIYNVTNIVQENKTKENTDKPIGITGGVIGTLLSKGNFTIILGIFAFIFVVSIISRIIIKLKKK